MGAAIKHEQMCLLQGLIKSWVLCPKHVNLVLQDQAQPDLSPKEEEDDKELVQSYRKCLSFGCGNTGEVESGQIFGVH